jgi:predicted DNA binding protein
MLKLQTHSGFHHLFLKYISADEDQQESVYMGSCLNSLYVIYLFSVLIKLKRGHCTDFTRCSDILEKQKKCYKGEEMKVWLI